MAETPSEFSVLGKGDGMPTPTLNNPDLLIASCPADGITVPLMNEESSKIPANASTTSVGKSDGTCVDEVAHTLKSPLSAEIPVSLKVLSQGRGTGFVKQEILFLAKAFIRASTDPIVGTLQTEQKFFQSICDIYNQQVANYNKQNTDAANFVPFTS